MMNTYKSNKMTRKLLSVFLLFTLSSSSSFSQAVGDFVSIASGVWGSNTTWGIVTGTGPLTWTPAGAGFFPAASNNVYVRAGDTVRVVSPGPYYCTNLTVESGGLLYANSTASNVYVTVTGNILCDGTIGDPTFSTFDAISFNIDGANCTISGSGTFSASRLRKNNPSPSVTNLTINMNVSLWFPTNSTTQIYNNANNSMFNVTIGAAGVVNLLSNGGVSGNACIDGLDGTSANNAGGNWQIDGSLIVSGKLFLTNNNAAGYPCNWVINGQVQATEIVAGASGAAGNSLTVNAGGLLEITGTPAWSTVSPTGNSYTFQSGSTVQYSANGAQIVRVPAEFASSPTANQYYGNLILSGSGNKSCLLGPIWTKNDLRIQGSAVFVPVQSGASAVVWVGGNWANWGTGGFSEGFTTVRFNNGLSINQTITCPGGEDYYILIQISPNNILRFNNAVNVIQFQMASGNGLTDLNGNTLTVKNSAQSAILGGATTRYIISEKTDNSSKVTWKVGTATGNYIIPFGIAPASASNYIPVNFSKTTTVDLGDITISTYGTPATNLPWPTTPTPVTNLQADNAVYNAPDNRGYCVDRFWQIDATGSATLDSLRFTYRGTERPALDLSYTNLKAQYWVSGISYWNRTQFGMGYAGASSAGFVTVPGFNIYNTAWTLSSIISPLPIELISFTAKKEQANVRLQWVTASEINNDYFSIERSLNGIDYIPFAQIDGAGNSTTMMYYSLLDKDAPGGIVYYRLKQVDFNGDYSYSDPAVVNLKEKESSILAFPNPVLSDIYIPSDDTKQSFIKIYNITGALIMENPPSENVGGLTKIPLQSLPKGVYLLSIQNESDQHYIRLVKE